MSNCILTLTHYKLMPKQTIVLLLQTLNVSHQSKHRAFCTNLVQLTQISAAYKCYNPMYNLYDIDLYTYLVGTAIAIT